MLSAESSGESCGFLSYFCLVSGAAQAPAGWSVGRTSRGNVIRNDQCSRRRFAVEGFYIWRGSDIFRSRS